MQWAPALSPDIKDSFWKEILMPVWHRNNLSMNYIFIYITLCLRQVVSCMLNRFCLFLFCTSNRLIMLILNLRFSNWYCPFWRTCVIPANCQLQLLWIFIYSHLYSCISSLHAIEYKVHCLHYAMPKCENPRCKSVQNALSYKLIGYEVLAPETIFGKCTKNKEVLRADHLAIPEHVKLTLGQTRRVNWIMQMHVHTRMVGPENAKQANSVSIKSFRGSNCKCRIFTRSIRQKRHGTVIRVHRHRTDTREAAQWMTQNAH